MKALLIVKFAVEAPTGFLLLVSPSTLVWLLFGLPLASHWSMVVRLLGIALLALGVVCLQVRDRSEGHLAKRLIVGLLAYDFAVVAILLVTRIDENVFGILLWPGILLHAGLALWSLVEIRKAHS
jgi:hypothetical protein